MREQISSYLQKRKSWSVKNVLSNYFKAANLHADICREYHAGRDIPFDKIKQLSDILYESKEELYLVYKRLRDPRKIIFENAEKFTPNEAEMDFIHNVGLLFHKATVARELVYMLEYYETDADEDFYELEHSLDDYIHRLSVLFEKGALLIQQLLRNFQDDVVVLSYFLEHERYVESVLGVAIASIFEQLLESESANSLYIKVAEYFMISGWKDRAKKILYCALQNDPLNEHVRDLLVQCG